MSIDQLIQENPGVWRTSVSNELRRIVDGILCGISAAVSVILVLCYLFIQQVIHL